LIPLPVDPKVDGMGGFLPASFLRPDNGELVNQIDHQERC
jgi:hypothetical protein